MLMKFDKQLTIKDVVIEKHLIYTSVANKKYVLFYNFTNIPHGNQDSFSWAETNFENICSILLNINLYDSKKNQGCMSDVL